MNRRGAVLFAIMSVIWGVPYLLIRVAVRDLTPATLVEGRTLIGALCLLPVAAARRQLRPLLAHWRPLLAYTVVEIGAPWYLLSDAERRLSSSLSGLLVASVPFIGVGLSLLSGRRERVGRRRVAGLAVGLAGVGLLLGLDVGAGDVRSVVEIGAVAIGYASGPLIVSRYLAGLPSLGLAGLSLGVAAVAYLPVAIVQAPSRVPNGRVLASVVVLGVVCTAVAFVAFFELIAEVGPTRATVITYVNPAVAVVLGVTFLGESFGLASAVGFVFILAGSVLATSGAPPIAGPSMAPRDANGPPSTPSRKMLR